jgi:hypothetical protein
MEIRVRMDVHFLGDSYSARNPKHQNAQKQERLRPRPLGGHLDAQLISPSLQYAHHSPGGTHISFLSVEIAELRCRTPEAKQDERGEARHFNADMSVYWHSLLPY